MWNILGGIHFTPQPPVTTGGVREWGRGSQLQILRGVGPVPSSIILEKKEVKPKWPQTNRQLRSSSLLPCCPSCHTQHTTQLGEALLTFLMTTGP